MLEKITRKTKKAQRIFTEYGPSYVAKRAAFQVSLRTKPTQKISYKKYVELTAPTQRQLENHKKNYEARDEKTAPRFIVWISTDGVPEAAVQRSKVSLKNQTYRPEKVLLGEKSTLAQRMEEYAQKQGEERLWVLMLPAGDVCESDFIYRIAQEIQKDSSDKIWYTDHEEWPDASGDYEVIEGCCKPDFSEDMLCAWNYIGTAYVAPFSLWKGLWDEDAYAFLLDMAARRVPFGHVAMLLYQAQQYDIEKETNDPAAWDEKIRAVYQAYGGEELESVSLSRDDNGICHPVFAWKGRPKVSVIIPTKDHVADLYVCLRSLTKQTIFDSLEILIVENNSTAEMTENYYEWLETGKMSGRVSDRLLDQEVWQKLQGHFRILRWEHGFNYAAINNFAEREATGEYVLLLNNDIELINDTALERLLEIGRREDVGMVGAKLYYEDDTLQHGGVIIGLGGVAGHFMVGIRRGDAGYLKQADCLRRVSGVTAACMLVKKSVYDQVGGLNETYEVDFNDVDFCMRVAQTGAKIVYQPLCEAWHYESKTRGTVKLGKENVERFRREIAQFLGTWGTWIQQGDPFYNQNLTMKPNDCSYGNPYLHDDRN